MLSEEYAAITRFLTRNEYPASIIQAQIPSHAKKNFRVKALQYVIGEENKLFKVLYANTSIWSLSTIIVQTTHYVHINKSDLE